MLISAFEHFDSKLCNFLLIFFLLIMLAFHTRKILLNTVHSFNEKVGKTTDE